MSSAQRTAAPAPSSTAARQIAPLGLADLVGPLHLSRVSALAAACGVYALPPARGALRFRSLVGHTCAFPVAPACRILDAAAVEDLRTRLYALAARGRIAPLASVPVAELAAPGVAMRLPAGLDVRQRIRLAGLAGWRWNWRDAQRRGWLIDPYRQGSALADLWTARCVQLARPVVILRGGCLIADARHLRPAAAREAAALGARIRAELIGQYARVYPRRQIGPRYDTGDGWTVRVGHLSAGEAAILGRVFLDTLCAVLCPAPRAAGAESEALP